MLKKTYCKLLLPLFLLAYPIAHASMDGWYVTGKLGGRILGSATHRDIIGLASLGFNVGYQFNKPFSAEVGFFSGGSKVYSATEEQTINYGVAHLITGIKSTFWSYSTFELYSKIGIGIAVFPKENTASSLSAVTQIGGKYLITPEIPVGLSFSLISTSSPMLLMSIDISYYFG